MKSNKAPGDTAPARRKPRVRTPKASPPQDDFAPVSVPEEIEEFVQTEKIFKTMEANNLSREQGFFIELEIAPFLIAAAFIFFLFSQVLALQQSASALTLKAKNLDREMQRLNGVRGDASGLIQQHRVLIDETQRVSANYNAFLMELLQLAETDTDARAVVEKFHIKNNPAEPPGKK